MTEEVKVAPEVEEESTLSVSDVADESQTEEQEVQDEAATNSLDPEETQETEEASEGEEAQEPSELAQLLAKHEKEIAQLSEERDQYLDQWRRSAAEFQNFKKREERLRLDRQRQANRQLIKKLLPVLDDLQRGAEHIPAELSDNDWVKGMLAIERKLWNILEQDGVSPIEVTPGVPFNPTIHEALMSLEHEEFETEQIIHELQRGYRHHDSILRPARVSVAR